MGDGRAVCITKVLSDTAVLFDTQELGGR